ncbi:P-loop containing nucleoside triphosphate hydrolase protein [Periconia macrospinosa]|uniref:P-loop containing nucleoside triphosphate hydrolase protein n=1 Tax=Periconia macrospinosa TaxID=97972 RepID=A0A2V1DU76_9PLEO|nr:P-loop containing nucleoside triphosphate hydrolase protein [Periconia macrospinosa]
MSAIEPNQAVVAGEEMNAHLSERFPIPIRGKDNHPDPDPLSTPSATRSRANNDIEKYFKDAETPVTGAGPWLYEPEIPTPSDILQDPNNPKASAFIEQTGKLVEIPDDLYPRPNKIEGPYKDNEDYLQTQYNLLKEDCLGPLREAVNQVRKDPLLDEAEYPQSASIGIYDPVYITGIVFSPRGLAVRVAFSLNRVKKFVRWKQSKRLITGTLVALTPHDDGFQSKCILATVAARPLSALEVNPPEIDLFFQPEDLQIDPMKKWIMVESRSSFFEASRHTLSSLQHLMREPFPLAEHVVGAKKEIEAPQYLKNQPYTDLSSLVSMEEAHTFENVNILQPQSWPSGDTHGLDESQSSALQRILTKQLAIVQGPPGTGKTYVSVVALKILLANKHDAPIIVTCQTNHALDQLLRHVAEFEPNFIRLGGRSKDTDKIKKRTLFEVRNNNQQFSSAKKRNAASELRQLTARMQILLKPLEMGQTCLDQRALAKLDIITEEQAESLENVGKFAMGSLDAESSPAPGFEMEQWMGRSLIQSRRPIQADDFGLAYEEEDFDEVEQLEELEAEAVARDDDDIDALKGPVTALCDNVTGKSSGPQFKSDSYVQNLLSNAPDLTTIPVAHRGGIYRYFQRKTKEIILNELRGMAKRYEVLVKERKIGQWEQDQQLLASSPLIGLTTTGLSKYRPLISSLRSRVVLVEEAAETLEAPVTAACLPTLEHLILVGDHQQLRPHCHVHKFEDEPYYLNVSLFERMIFNDLDISCLTRQRRMIPEVRRLLKPIYGDTLQDHHSVRDLNNRPPVEGMGINSYFFTHEWPESRNVNMSCQNDLEADMIVGFFDYLVMNGIEPTKITVLTFYNGQRSLLLKKLRAHHNLRHQAPTLNVVTVDSYQGEENDIVILSLVRSNKTGGIGFLENDNRICVALSRARRGFYLFGNGEKLAVESGTWSEVITAMYGKSARVGVDLPENSQQTRRIGFMLPLRCTNHGNDIYIQRPTDWGVPNGGCCEPCNCTLPCGHRCMLNCHPFDKDLINCMQMCSRQIGCGHPCSAVCSDPCRCNICERRSGGVKAIMKTQKSAVLPPVRTTPTPTMHMPAIAPDASPAPAQVTMSWLKYVNGGVNEDDAKIREQAVLEEARFQSEVETASMQEDLDAHALSGRLIEVSPRKNNKNTVSQNTEMLVNFGVDLPSEPPLPVLSPAKPGRANYKENFSLGLGARASPSKPGKRFVGWYHGNADANGNGKRSTWRKRKSVRSWNFKPGALLGGEEP